jgi:hypothetical protein
VGHEAPARVREWLDALDGISLPRGTAFDARLLTTELVANAVRHAGSVDRSEIAVTISRSDSSVRVVVCDGGPGFELSEVPLGPTDQGGRGLMIVAAVASHWGVQAGPPFAVWFELALDRTSRDGHASRERGLDADWTADLPAAPHSEPRRPDAGPEPRADLSASALRRRHARIARVV